MMSVFLLTILVGVVFLVLKVGGYRYSLLHLLLVGLVLKTYGLFLIGGERFSYEPFYAHIIFFLAMLLGVLGLGKKASSNNGRVLLLPGVISSKIDSSLLVFCLVFVGFLFICICVYHFSIIGVPILNDNVEVMRFRAADSGVFGIPSRMVNFGVLFVFLSLILMRCYRMISFRLALALMIFPALVILSSGSKSSFIIILHMFLLCFRFFRQGIPLLAVIISSVLSLMYFAFVFSKYQTLAGYDFFDYILVRMTIINANIFDYIYTEYVEKVGFGYGIGIVQDAIYPFGRLLGENVSTINMQISRSFYGMSESGFSVPVTPGLFGYFYLQVGFWLTIVMCYFVGVLYRLIYNIGCRCQTIFSKTAVLFLEYIVFIAIASGNPVYAFINYLAGALLVLFLFCFAWTMIQFSLGVGIRFRYVR